MVQVWDLVTATWICSTEGKRRRLSGKKMEMAGGGGKEEDVGACSWEHGIGVDETKKPLNAGFMRFPMSWKRCTLVSILMKCLPSLSFPDHTKIPFFPPDVSSP